MNLTVEEVACLLRLLEQTFGRGYSDVPEVASLQAKLSVMGEAARQMDKHSTPIVLPDAPLHLDPSLLSELEAVHAEYAIMQAKTVRWRNVRSQFVDRLLRFSLKHGNLIEELVEEEANEP